MTEVRTRFATASILGAPSPNPARLAAVADFKPLQSLTRLQLRHALIPDDSYGYSLLQRPAQPPVDGWRAYRELIVARGNLW
jgi:hypothetical protein